MNRGLALNLSELAVVSGWGVSSLTGMRLPLINGKIPYDDFRRILRLRQDALEKANRGLTYPFIAPIARPASLLIEDVGHRQKDADKFYGPSLKRGVPGALRRLRGVARSHSNG
jgi:hypothetical protein